MSTGKIHSTNHPVKFSLKKHSKLNTNRFLLDNSLPGLLASPDTFKNKVLISLDPLRDDFLPLIVSAELYDELLLSSVSLPEELELLYELKLYKQNLHAGINHNQEHIKSPLLYYTMYYHF